MINPPPPKSAAGPSGHYMEEASARMALGKHFALWQRLGDLTVQHDDLRWSDVWRAAMQLIREGHAPRDRRIVELARQLMRDEQDYFDNIERRRQRRQERRERGSSNGEDQAVDGGR